MKGGYVKKKLKVDAVLKKKLKKDGVVTKKLKEGGVMKKKKKKVKEDGVLKQKLKEGRLLKRKLQEDEVLQKLKEGRVTKKRPKEDRMLKKKLKEGGILKDLLKEGGVLKKPPNEGGVLKENQLKEGGSPKKKLKDSQGSITFEKILRPTSSPASGSRSSLTVPSWFIKQHGDELRQSVVLRSAATKEEWTVQLGAYYPRKAAQVKFYAGWGDFASSNDLGEGDLLVFCLRKVSQFDVYIYRKARSPDSSPSLQDTEPSRKRTKAYKKKNKKARRSDLSVAELLAKEQVTEYKANPNPPFKSSASPAPRQKLKDLPCFIKRIVASNLHDAAGYANGACLQGLELVLFAEHGVCNDWIHFMEIPHSFATEHDKQLRKSVKLRGFTEGSPVRVVACKSNVQRRQTRLYLRNGWSSFVSDNNLRLGQVLVFTLTGYSSFVVKEAPAS